jgi:chromosome segregation ATPase
LEAWIDSLSDAASRKDSIALLAQRYGKVKHEFAETHGTMKNLEKKEKDLNINASTVQERVIELHAQILKEEKELALNQQMIPEKKRELVSSDQERCELKRLGIDSVRDRTTRKRVQRRKAKIGGCRVRSAAFFLGQRYFGRFERKE